LRIAVEALTNVEKHALATRVWVKLENTPQRVELVVKDNGQGFSLAGHEQNPTGHHGLIIMKERAESLGGTCDIVSNPGEGTEIRVSLPIEKVRL